MASPARKGRWKMKRTSVAYDRALVSLFAPRDVLELVPEAIHRELRAWLGAVGLRVEEALGLIVCLVGLGRERAKGRGRLLLRELELVQRGVALLLLQQRCQRVRSTRTLGAIHQRLHHERPGSGSGLGGGRTAGSIRAGVAGG